MTLPEAIIVATIFLVSSLLLTGATVLALAFLAYFISWLWEIFKND